MRKVAEAAVVGYPMTPKGTVHLCLCNIKDRCREVGRLEEGTGCTCEEPDRADCNTGKDPVGRWSAEDEERQDHAEDIEEGSGE